MGIKTELQGALSSVSSIAGAGRGLIAGPTAEQLRKAFLPVPGGAEAKEKPKPIVQTYSITGKKMTDDMRVKIRIPPWYWTGLTSGSNSKLSKLGGIIFPYTPSINFDSKADYTSQQPLHSNFLINFYQKSSISSIQISGKFTVENKEDAENYLSTMHLLKALTKMPFGKDLTAGSPPPVCRLDAYGDMMLTNVPVAITMYKTEWPEDVDFYTIDGTDYYGKNSVPTRSTIAVTCLPMYSRNEMQGFSVNEYINSRNMKGFI
jgi:hypothetical protein